MGLQTKAYLVPLVEVEEAQNGEVIVTRQYKTYLYLPDYKGTEETYHWMESSPADDPSYRFVVLTADEAVHQDIALDPDIVEL